MLRKRRTSNRDKKAAVAAAPASNTRRTMNKCEVAEWQRIAPGNRSTLFRFNMSIVWLFIQRFRIRVYWLHATCTWYTDESLLRFGFHSAHTFSRAIDSFTHYALRELRSPTFKLWQLQLLRDRDTLSHTIAHIMRGR